jgi:hypothetical protein
MPSTSESAWRSGFPIMAVISPATLLACAIMASVARSQRSTRSRTGALRAARAAAVARSSTALICASSASGTEQAAAKVNGLSTVRVELDMADKIVPGSRRRDRFRRA